MASAATARQSPRIKIVGHSMLFYWWPVWLVGFVLAALTYVDGYRLAILPENTHVKDLGERKYELRVDQPSEVLANAADAGRNKPAFPVRISDNKSFGVLYAVVLLLVIVITTVPLRGLWSVLVIVVVVLTSVILALSGWWGPLLEALGHLHIYMNMAGYLLISLVLFLLWLVTFLFFDQQMYMVFTPGELRVCLEIGGGETAYTTTNVTVEKRRSDLFRHWILGLGSGDLIVNAGGGQAQAIVLPNVLFIDKKLQQITDQMRERPVVPGT